MWNKSDWFLVKIREFVLMWMKILCCDLYEFGGRMVFDECKVKENIDFIEDFSCLR